jgi:hypothetical protein
MRVSFGRFLIGGSSSGGMLGQHARRTARALEAAPVAEPAFMWSTEPRG